MKRLARGSGGRQGGRRGGRGAGNRGNRSAEVIGCEPSAIRVTSLQMTPLPIYVIIPTTRNRLQIQDCPLSIRMTINIHVTLSKKSYRKSPQIGIKKICKYM